MADADYSNEIWKTIPFAPDYAVSDFGRVKRIRDSRRRAKAGELLKLHEHQPNGKYLYLRLWINQRSHFFYVHQLVALVFIGQPLGDGEAYQVAHNDGNGLNNRPSNLRWATPIENRADQLIHGTTNRGERCGSAKLSRDDVRVIRASDARPCELSKIYAVNEATIRDIRTRRRWAWLD